MTTAIAIPSLNWQKLFWTLDPQTPLNEIVIGKIERGERTILDDQTLLNLADALKLTIGERRVFFVLATGLDHLQIYPAEENGEEILAPVLNMLADIRLPALLLDRYLDVVAVNGLLLKLYQLSEIDLSTTGGQAGRHEFIGFHFLEGVCGNARSKCRPRCGIALPWAMSSTFGA